MTDELWTSAKHIAQSDGRKDDWVYVVDVYKSIGGNQMALMIFADGKRQEVLGELEQDVLVCDALGELGIISKSTYMKSKKKFLKRDTTGATALNKSLVKDGKIYMATIYKGAKLS